LESEGVMRREGDSGREGVMGRVEVVGREGVMGRLWVTAQWDKQVIREVKE
jgi:hypothetical protein